MEAIVLAGGLGTRLRARVGDRPKPMAEVAGRPFLALLLDYLEVQGFTRVVLSVGYRREAISGYFGARSGGIDLHYAVEAEPLGTGGAITHALAESLEDPLWVLNGDTMLHLDYQAMLAAHAHGGPADMRMAHGAGARAIAVASGVASIAELAPDADVVVESIALLVSPAPS